MDHITMSKKEREQLIVFDRLQTGEIKQIEAALQLGISTRWVRAKHKRFCKFGAKGLKHGGRDKTSKRRWNEKERHLMVSLLKTEWAGFGPTFTAEKLWELHDIKVSKETVRRAMIEAAVWQAKKKRKKHRKRRERRSMLGLMVQLDGSPHDWFEGRASKCTLLVFIDDATSSILWLEFVKSESHMDVMRATKNYIEQYDRPHEFYVDFGSVFSVNLNNAERVKKTQWERAVEALGVKVRHAYSPQAKGRVERCNSTMQDRLVKEMRLAKVPSIEEANRFLRETNFIAKHNKRFAVPAHQKGDAHKPNFDCDLNKIFCIKEKRVLTNDYTVTFNKRIFQLTNNLSARPKDRITVNTHLDSSITLTIRKVNLEFEEIASPPKRKPVEEKIRPYKPFKPSENSRLWAQGSLPVCGPNSTDRRVG